MDGSVVVESPPAPTAHSHGWRELTLPGRGDTWACDVPGPSPSSPVVVLLHGLLATGSLNWGAHIDALTSRFRVIAIDHRGHGRGLAAPFTLESCADDVVALLDELGVDRAIFAGYSMGGPIAQLVWRRHPHRVDGLVLCATAATFRRTPLDAKLLVVLDRAGRALEIVPRPLVTGLRRSVAAMLGATLDSTGEVAIALAAHDLGSLRAAVRAIHEFSSVDWLGAMTGPAAVVVMTRDRVVPTRRQMMLADLLPQAALVRVKGDHLACNRAESGFGAALLAACAVVNEAAATDERSRRPRGLWRPRARRWLASRARRGKRASIGARCNRRRRRVAA